MMMLLMLHGDTGWCNIPFYSICFCLLAVVKAMEGVAVVAVVVVVLVLEAVEVEVING